MILDKEVEITGNEKTIKHYRNLGYKISVEEKIKIKPDDLTKGSKVKLNVQCDVCKTKKNLGNNEYISNTKNLTEPYCCSHKCSQVKYKKICFLKYGFSNVFQDNTIKQKSRETLIKNYDVENPMFNIEIRKKIETTNLKKYGFENPMKNELIKEKCKNTMMKNHGVEHPLQKEEIFYKQQKSFRKVNKYKDTDLTYQGTYEKYFLEQMELIGKLNEVSKQ